jgi:hypothetical protein
MSGGVLPTLLLPTTPGSPPVKFISLKSNPDRAPSSAQKRLKEAPFPLGFAVKLLPYGTQTFGFLGQASLSLPQAPLLGGKKVKSPVPRGWMVAAHSPVACC